MGPLLTDAMVVGSGNANERGSSNGEAMAACDRFRATGITTYLENRGTIEKEQQTDAHESPRTTKLYDRTNESLHATRSSGL
jgi:hypothetical protein